ncbi:MAG TPA: hypothetical protein VFF06_13230 [Polyangia bacterium]|nr:hypothetical protein [Polyangia bacterium]
MNRKLTVAAAMLVAVAGAIAFFALRSPPPPPRPAPGPSAHGSGIDNAMAAATALYDAPDGTTPCETAYNAFAHSEDVAKNAHVTAVVLRLAPRDEFLARCGALPPATQQCLAPKYLRGHREECARSRMSPDALKPMVELKQAGTAVSNANEPPPPN